jgi:hypothetical protein
MRSHLRSVVGLVTAAAGAAAASYTGYVAITWWRYGQPKLPLGAEADPLLDRFMPIYEVAERHQVDVHAPAETTFAAACEMNLLDAPVTRGIFRAREVMLGSTPDAERRPAALLPLVQSLGWGVLAVVAGREIVVGAVTRPWEPNVTFQALPPEEFAAFHDPGYAKIVWTLRADPIGGSASVFRTETRVTTTDAVSRSKFRRYWSLLSPGILLIRRLSLQPLRREAERRARDMWAVGSAVHAR